MKRILFITYDYPFPTTSGGKNRAYHMLKYSKGDFKKYLFSFIRRDFSQSSISEMEKIGVDTVGTIIRRNTTDARNMFTLFSNQSVFKTLYYSKKIVADLLRIIVDNKIDIVHFESFYTGFYISPEIKKLGAKQVFGTENIEYKLYEDYAKGKRVLKKLFEREVKKIKSEEIDMFRNSDMNLAVTDEEVKVIKNYSNHCVRIPNGIDVDNFTFKKPGKKEAYNLLFVGNFSYFPNIAAIENFYKNVFRLLPREFKLTVIGKKVKTLSFVKDPQITAIEFISDIKDAYSDADILISPVKIGGGTNFKILEAMAAGVPVIAYGERLAAVGVEHNKHVTVVKDDEEFREKIIDLSSDLAHRQKLTLSAREFVEAEFSWKVIGKKLAETWRNL